MKSGCQPCWPTMMRLESTLTVAEFPSARSRTRRRDSELRFHRGGRGRAGHALPGSRRGRAARYFRQARRLRRDPRADLCNAERLAPYSVGQSEPGRHACQGGSTRLGFDAMNSNTFQDNRIRRIATNTARCRMSTRPRGSRPSRIISIASRSVKNWDPKH